MVRGGGSVHIDRDPAEVFEFVADAENNPRWHPYVKETRWLDAGPIRVGRRGRQTSRLLGFSYTVEAEVLEWEPPRRVVLGTVAGDATVRTVCEVTPEAGGCRLDIWTEGEFTNPLLRLLSPILILTLKRQALSDLRRLGEVLAKVEASSRSG
jgi:uncharacterized protein YndB with AHSA1/START domain